MSLMVQWGNQGLNGKGHRAKCGWESLRPCVQGEVGEGGECEGGRAGRPHCSGRFKAGESQTRLGVLTVETHVMVGEDGRAVPLGGPPDHHVQKAIGRLDVVFLWGETVLDTLGSPTHPRIKRLWGSPWSCWACVQPPCLTRGWDILFSSPERAQREDVTDGAPLPRSGRRRHMNWSADQFSAPQGPVRPVFPMSPQPLGPEACPHHVPPLLGILQGLLLLEANLSSTQRHNGPHLGSSVTTPMLTKPNPHTWCHLHALALAIPSTSNATPCDPRGLRQGLV